MFYFLFFFFMVFPIWGADLNDNSVSDPFSFPLESLEVSSEEETESLFEKLNPALFLWHNPIPYNRILHLFSSLVRDPYALTAMCTGLTCLSVMGGWRIYETIEAYNQNVTNINALYNKTYLENSEYVRSQAYIDAINQNMIHANENCFPQAGVPFSFDSAFFFCYQTLMEAFNALEPYVIKRTYVVLPGNFSSYFQEFFNDTLQNTSSLSFLHEMGNTVCNKLSTICNACQHCHYFDSACTYPNLQFFHFMKEDPPSWGLFELNDRELSDASLRMSL